MAYDINEGFHKFDGEIAQGQKVESARNVAANTINENNWLELTQQRASKGDDAALDALTEWYASEASSKTARDYETERNAHVVDTLMEQYKRNGLNPYWLIDSGSVGSVNYTANSNKYSNSGYLAKTKAEREMWKGASQTMVQMLSAVVSAAFLAYMIL